MCSGGRFVADFSVGTPERPEVPEAVGECLTLTAEGDWVVWARKVARVFGNGNHFRPLTGDGSYPVDAVARCRRGERHTPPQRHCTCGFHALSGSLDAFGAVGLWLVQLDVALSGRILAFEWEGGGLLFRAARQTVARVRELECDWVPPPPEEPGGRLARLVRREPRGAGPVRLSVPRSAPPVVSLADDAGYCVASCGTGEPWPLTAVPALV
ncbi:MAG: hypothetical protein M3144_00510 [Actinomycetota bacterium]|nr:hypothetical protein [Actinomycetota bacterium]